MQTQTRNLAVERTRRFRVSTWRMSMRRAVHIYLIAPIYNVVQFNYRLSLIPDALQGRVNSTFRLLAFGFTPLALDPMMA
jgi:hypothetical protein